MGVESLLAGWVAGYAMGVFSLGLVATRLAPLIRSLQGRVPAGMRLPLIGVVLALGLQLLWSVVGVALGAVYWAIHPDARAGLGSPNWGFTLTMLVLGVLFVVAAVGLQPSWSRRALLAAIVFVALFGWMLPHLSDA